MRFAMCCVIVASWAEDRDTKLRALIDLVRVDHPNDKLLIFTQFADTARYLETALKKAGCHCHLCCHWPV